MLVLLSKIFYHVLIISITSSIFVLFVIGLRIVLKHRAVRLMCFLWGVVMLRLLFPFSLPGRSENSFISFQSWETINGLQPESGQESLHSNSIGVTEDVPLDTVPTSNLSAKENAVSTSLSVILPVGAVLWLSGMLVLLLKNGILYLKLCKSTADAIQENGFFLSPSIPVPFLLGFIRPRIYLPTALDMETRKLALLHEQTHQRIHDNLLRLIESFVLMIHWINPLVWIAFHFCERDLELRCDTLSVSDMTEEERKSYINAMLLCAKRHPIATSAISFGNGSLRERAENIAFPQKSSFIISITTVTIAIIFFSVSLAMQKEEKPNVHRLPIPVPYDNQQDIEIAKAYFPEDYIGYRYPVLPTMSTWPYGNHADMVSVCQIPENVLKEMSTEELLESVLYYPLFPDAYLYDSRQKAYEIFKNSMGAFAELSRREDRVACLDRYWDTHRSTSYLVTVVSEEISHANPLSVAFFLAGQEDFQDSNLSKILDDTPSTYSFYQ